jgi:glyoxylase-like metal-dependent hydrolase (beta-lactamase superfamily II)
LSVTSLPAIERFDTNTGVRIYRIPMMLFPPEFIGFSYVILNGDAPVLVDAGSGYGDSNADLLRGIEALRDDFGESLSVSDIDTILVTHGHIDHIGGVAFIQEKTGAKIGIHPLDRRVLTNFEERVVMATKDLRRYLESAGTSEDRQQEMLSMYGFAKHDLRPVSVDFDLDENLNLHGMQVIHTPGHCAGQVCLRIGDVLLSADHVLAKTLPHQSPEEITPYTGLGHYRESLQKVAKLDGIRLALGGHETPIYNFYARIEEIKMGHERKLNRVMDIVKRAGQPCTADEITQAMYPDRMGFDILLALEEAGAYVEYLYQRGALSVANLDEMAQAETPPLRYVLA